MPIPGIGTAGSLARVDHIQTAYTCRKNLGYVNDATGVQILIGIVPANSWLKRTTGVYVATAFNTATTATVDIGTVASPTLYASAVDAKTTGDKIASAAVFVPVETPIYARINQVGTAATAGLLTVIIEYYPDLN